MKTNKTLTIILLLLPFIVGAETTDVKSNISALSNAPRGVGRFLLKSMVDECARRGLDYLAYGSRIPGYHLHSDSLSVEEYVAAVKSGKIIDTVLSIANLLDFKVGAVIDNYYNDKESLSFGVVV